MDLAIVVYEIPVDAGVPLSGMKSVSDRLRQGHSLPNATGTRKSQL